MTHPTLIFTPGAWHQPKCFATVIERLESAGYECLTVSMPSVGRDPPVQSLDDDIAAVREAVLKEFEAGKHVMVVSHSWSGLPVSSALVGMGKKERESSGEKGGVVKIAYIAAFVTPEGTSLLDALNHKIPEWWIIKDDETLVKDPSVFYNDMEPAEINHWGSQLLPHAFATKKAKSTGAAWLTIPCSYLLCELDQAIPIFAQEAMVGAAQEAGSNMETERVKTSHSPFLSKPDAVVAYLRRAAGETGNFGLNE